MTENEREREKEKLKKMRGEKEARKEKKEKMPYFLKFIKNIIFYIFSQKFHVNNDSPTGEVENL